MKLIVAISKSPELIESIINSGFVETITGQESLATVNVN